ELSVVDDAGPLTRPGLLVAGKGTEIEQIVFDRPAEDTLHGVQGFENGCRGAGGGEGAFELCQVDLLDLADAEVGAKVLLSEGEHLQVAAVGPRLLAGLDVIEEQVGE